MLFGTKLPKNSPGPFGAKYSVDEKALVAPTDFQIIVLSNNGEFWGKRVELGKSVELPKGMFACVLKSGKQLKYRFDGKNWQEYKS